MPRFHVGAHTRGWTKPPRCYTPAIQTLHDPVRFTGQVERAVDTNLHLARCQRPEDGVHRKVAEDPSESGEAVFKCLNARAQQDCSIAEFVVADIEVQALDGKDCVVEVPP